jgi:hypothetical protein
MATTSIGLSKSIPRSRAKPVSTAELKAELRGLMGSTREWNSTDSQARGLLYNLLGTIFELSTRLTTSSSKEALRAECARCAHIRQSKMFKIADRPVDELLIAYALGTDDRKAASRSQWKKVIRKGRSAKLPAKRKVFSDWLHDKGGIEGVLSGGKQKAVNKAVRVPFDLADFASAYDSSASSIQLSIDLAETPSFSDKSSYTNGFALVLLKKAKNLETGAMNGFAVVDVVNNSELVAMAAQTIDAQHKKKH